MSGEMGGADDRDGSGGALPVRGRRRFDGGRHGVVIPFSNQELAGEDHEEGRRPAEGATPGEPGAPARNAVPESGSGDAPAGRPAVRRRWRFGLLPPPRRRHGLGARRS